MQQKAHSGLEIIKLLADLDAKLELQVAEDLFDEAIDLIGSEGLLAGLEVQAESHTLLVSAQLFAAVDVEQLHPGQLLAGALHLGDEGAALHAFGSNQGQIRVMDMEKPPIKVLVPGRVFRSDSDATHSPMFHQMEGLVVDKGITLCDLQGMLDKFVQALFGADVKTRLRPSYFPFTEPSVEVDVSCFECGGKGCPLCKHTGWIEVLGAGVVHHSVLENCGIDPNVYSGFAFGIGIERIAMLKYGINNIGLMFENDLRFLKQFED